jgi:putative nucleotidyltransferase with HDIG domain
VSNDKGKTGSQSATGRRSAVHRKLSYPSRVREAVRGGSDRVLGVDLGWSAAFIVISMLLLGSQRCAVSYPKLEAGETAEHDVFVHTDIQVIDHQATEGRRAEARAAVPEVFVYDVRPMRRHIDELAAIFGTGRDAMEAAEEESLGEARTVLERLAGPALDVLIDHEFSADLEAKLTAPLQEVMGKWVIGNKATLERLPSVFLVTIPGEQGRTLTDYSSIIELSQAREHVRDAIRVSLELPAREEAFLAELGESFVEANLANVPARTDVRRKAAADEVLPVLLKIPAGTQLLAAGERVNEETLARLNAAREETQGTVGLIEFLGLVILVSMLAFFLHRYTRHHQRYFKKVKQLHALLVLVILCMALLAQAMLWLARGVVDNLGFPFNEVEIYIYLIPVGAGAILVTLLSNGRIAMVYSAFVTVLFGALAGWDFYMALWSLLVQWAGVYAISTYRERAALLRAGLVVGGAGAAVAVVMEVLHGTLDPLPRSMYGMGLAFLGGAVGVGLLVSFALPLLEGMFNVLTDIRLLELSNVNNPLLSQLAVKAPGSYNHSLVVGTLAEEGAKAIGANPLLCKVAAFYHDIGKIRKPEYYVENMLGRRDPTRKGGGVAAADRGYHSAASRHSYDDLLLRQGAEDVRPVVGTGQGRGLSLSRTQTADEGGGDLHARRRRRGGGTYGRGADCESPPRGHPEDHELHRSRWAIPGMRSDVLRSQPDPGSVLADARQLPPPTCRLSGIRLQETEGRDQGRSQERDVRGDRGCVDGLVERLGGRRPSPRGRRGRRPDASRFVSWTSRSSIDNAPARSARSPSRDFYTVSRSGYRPVPPRVWRSVWFRIARWSDTTGSSAARRRQPMFSRSPERMHRFPRAGGIWVTSSSRSLAPSSRPASSGTARNGNSRFFSSTVISIWWATTTNGMTAR